MEVLWHGEGFAEENENKAKERRSKMGDAEG
jgi:hypothetical protein